MKLKRIVKKILAGVSLIIAPSVLGYIAPPLQASPIGVVFFFTGIIFELLVFYLFFIEDD